VQIVSEYLTMEPSIPKLKTPGVLADDLGVPLHRVTYLLRTRRHIKPAATAGRLRLYGRDTLAMLRHELNATDARRDGEAGGEA
jgi:hypothetical protein